jgi:hypothetical protein
MKQEFFEFIESPEAENYEAIRKLVLAFPGYDPYSQDLYDLSDLLDAGKFVEVQQGVSRGMPNLLLSPRAHMLAAFAAEQTGDEKVADVEKYIAQACVKGILSTGAGTYENPYRVVRTSDEYDVLQYLEQEVEKQSLQSAEQKHLDVILTKQGREVVFDITDAYETLTVGLDEQEG